MVAGRWSLVISCSLSGLLFKNYINFIIKISSRLNGVYVRCFERAIFYALNERNAE